MTVKQKLAWDRGRLKGTLRMAYQALNSNTASTGYEKHLIEDILFSIESIEMDWDVNSIDLGLNIKEPKSLRCSSCASIWSALVIKDNICPACSSAKKHREKLLNRKPGKKLKIHYVQ